jgi:protein O-GlcNAc transferase
MPIMLPLVDGTQVVVPDSLQLITPYVLREQQDWFEDEIKFLRRILRSDQRVIDIGANYGIYALSMARAVVPQGKVWAFEPASATAAMLAQSIAANGFKQVVLEKCALSSQPGTARLSLHDNSELNELIRGKEAAGPSEEVPLTTLDEALQRHGWNDIAVVKIDAEGEEANILQGGKEFFSRLSPLILYEIKAGSTLHLELIAAFAALGYRSYRLVPGLDVLTPFQANAWPDLYLLNLFCCKADRAALLAADGYLIETATQVPSSLLETHYWNRTLANLPYGGQLLQAWKSSAQASGRGELDASLALFAFGNDRTQQPGLRFAALELSFNILRRLCDKSPPPPAAGEPGPCRCRLWRAQHCRGRAGKTGHHHAGSAGNRSWRTLPRPRGPVRHPAPARQHCRVVAGCRSGRTGTPWPFLFVLCWPIQQAAAGPHPPAGF